MQKLFGQSQLNEFINNTAGISFALIDRDKLRIQACANYKNSDKVDQIMAMIVILATQQVLTVYN